MSFPPPHKGRVDSRRLYFTALAQGTHAGLQAQVSVYHNEYINVLFDYRSRVWTIFKFDCNLDKEYRRWAYIRYIFSGDLLSKCWDLLLGPYLNQVCYMISGMLLVVHHPYHLLYNVIDKERWRGVYVRVVEKTFLLLIYLTIYLSICRLMNSFDRVRSLSILEKIIHHPWDAHLITPLLHVAYFKLELCRFSGNTRWLRASLFWVLVAR